MLQYHKRRPDVMVEVIRPNYNSAQYKPGDAEFIGQFASRRVNSFNEKYSDALISYNFKEALDSVEGNFNLEFTLEKDRNGRTWLDKLRIRDLVMISEFDKVQYLGYIDNIRLSAKIGSEGKPNRRILVSGGNMGKLLASFKLILDRFLYIGTEKANIESERLMASLAEMRNKGASIAPMLIAIYEDFFNLILKMGEVNPQGNGVKAILDYYIDYSKGLQKDLKLKYRFAPTLYQVGENSIWDIWKALIHPPVNELFGRWSPLLSEYSLIFRETPFDSKDWKNLKKNDIPPSIITGYDIGKSDQEVFTFYATSLPGQTFSERQAMAIEKAAVKIDEIKWSKYGYRPLIVKNRYFDRSQMEKFSADEVGIIMGKISTKMREWFEHNDEFCSGSLSFMTIDSEMWKDDKEYKGLANPRIGEKVGLLDGEFYVESSEHSWNYLGPMITTLQLSRGYRYTHYGIAKSPIFGTPGMEIVGGAELEGIER